jgi:hypothetical protein
VRWRHATPDDAGRLIPHAPFYAGQGLDAALGCLRQAIAAWGISVQLYIVRSSTAGCFRPAGPRIDQFARSGPGHRSTETKKHCEPKALSDVSSMKLPWLFSIFSRLI